MLGNAENFSRIHERWEMVVASREAYWVAGGQGWERALLFTVYPFVFLVFYYECLFIFTNFSIESERDREEVRGRWGERGERGGKERERKKHQLTVLLTGSCSI